MTFLAIDGTISEIHAEKITICLNHMGDIQEYVAQIEETALRLTAPYSTALKIIEAVPDKTFSHYRKRYESIK